MRVDAWAAAALLLGALLGLGLFLVISVKLWPRERNIRVVSSNGLSRRIAYASLQLGMPEPVFVLAQVIIAVMAGLLAYALTSVAAIALVAAAAGASVLWMVASAKVSASHKVLRLLWPDVVDALVSAIRSGANIPEALMALSASQEPRISGPAGEFAQDYRLTANFELSLDRLKARWASAASDRIIETLRLAREVGSSETTSVLLALGSHLRSESAMRQELEARQGWIKIAARIGLVAPWIVLIMLSTRAEAAQAYNSAAGLAVIGVGAALSFVAYRVMAGIGQLRTEERWMA